MTFLSKLPLYISCALFSSSTMVSANNANTWRVSNIQFLYGDQYEFGPAKRESITVETAGSWRYGESYFFTNIFNRSDVGTELYAEFYPRINWTAITQRPLPLPYLRDMSLVAGINIGNLPERDPFKAYMLGAGIDVDVPGMDYLKFDLMLFKSENAATTGLQFTPVWSMDFTIQQHRFVFRGFLDWQSSKATGGEASILTQPQLLLDIGHYYQQPDRVLLGIEYSYWHNQFGIDGAIERVPQAMLLIPF